MVQLNYVQLQAFYWSSLVYILNLYYYDLNISLYGLVVLVESDKNIINM